MMHQKGFTLAELLLTVAIISVLSAIAAPTYARHVAKENLKRAQSDLQSASLRFEHQYQRILSYPATGLATTEELKGVVPKWIATSNATEFNFSTRNASASSYELIATGLSGRVEDCVILLASDGRRTITNCDNLIDGSDWL